MGLLQEFGLRARLDGVFVQEDSKGEASRRLDTVLNERDTPVWLESGHGSRYPANRP